MKSVFSNSKHLGLVVLGLAVVLALAAPLGVLAQGTFGDLRGLVKDPTGAVIPGAKVTVTSDATGQERTAMTDASGAYHVGNLVTDVYTIKVEASGFKTYVRRGVSIATNRISEADASMEVGAAVETVEVVAGAELVQTQTATLGTTYTDYALSSVAVAGGSTLTGNQNNLAIYAPGTTTQPGGMAGQGGAIGGNRPRNNNFTVDGLDNNDPSVTGENGPVLAEAVKEFTLITNQFAAELGHSTAGQFIKVTETGTNEIHGRAWLYHQNQSYNSLDNLTRANSAFNTRSPRFDYNRFGGQVGGPILKNKLFYFGSYEYQNLGQEGVAASVVRVPTTAGLAALQALAGNAASGVSPVNVGIIRDFVPVAGTQTGSVNVCDQSIDATCAAAGARVAIPVGTFGGSTPQFQRTHLFLVSGDYQTSSHKVSGRYHYSRQRSIAAGALAVPIFTSSTIFDTKRITLSDVYNIGGNKVNELRVGWMRRVGPDQVLQSISAPGITDIFGNYRIIDLGLNIGPQGNFPQGQAGHAYQAADNFTYVRGTHTWKLGVDFRNILRTGGFLPRARGEYGWTAGAAGGISTLSGLDGFARDVFPNSVAIRGVGSGTYTQNRAAIYWFAQDTWRVHQRVTLEYGVRYEFTQTERDAKRQDENGLANLNNISGDPAYAALSQTVKDAITAHVGNSIIFRKPRADKDNWAPRVGIAWDVFGTGKTSLRAGAGRGFDVLFGNLALLQLPPQVQAENRESNACLLLPAPGWCAAVPAGQNPQTGAGSLVRFSGLGFIENGGLFPTLPLTTSQVASAARLATGNFVVDYEAPESWTWTLSIQQEFWKDWVVEVRYLGTRGLHLPVQRWLNAGMPTYFTNPELRLPVFTSLSEVPASFPAGSPTLAAFNTARLAPTGTSPLILRPFGFAGVMTEFSPVGTSSYHGGSADLRKRWSTTGFGGFLINSNYTWSRTIDNIENELFTSSINPRRPFIHQDVDQQRGLSAIHRAHKYALIWLYELPRWQGDSGALRKLLNGWQFGGSYLFETGQPVTLLSFRDVNGDGDTAGDWVFHNPGGAAGVGSDAVAVCWNGTTRAISTSQSCSGAQGNVMGYVASVADAEWIRAATGGIVNSGRGVHIGGEINNVNIEIGKQTPFWGEGRYIEFRAQFINVLNHPSFSIGQGSVFGLNGPATNNTGYVAPGNASFLKDNTFSGGLGQSPFQRVIQFAVKVVF